MKVLIFDTETTGLPIDYKGSIVMFAALLEMGWEWQDFSTRVLRHYGKNGHIYEPW